MFRMPPALPSPTQTLNNATLRQQPSLASHNCPSLPKATLNGVRIFSRFHQPEMPEYHKVPPHLQENARTPLFLLNNNQRENERRLATTPSARSNEDSQQQQQSRHRNHRWQLFIQQQQADRRLSHPISTSKGVRAPTTKGVPTGINLQRCPPDY